MEITKSTVWSALLLLLLATGLLVVREHFLHQRAVCGRRLAAMAPELANYARANHGRLPGTVNELTSAVGDKLQGYDGVVWQNSAEHPQTFIWKHVPAQPYLWETRQHPFVNGMFILYTDGTVQLSEALPSVQERKAP